MIKTLLTPQIHTTVSSLSNIAEVEVEGKENIETWDIKTPEDFKKLSKRHSDDMDNFLAGSKKAPRPLLVNIYYDSLYSEEIEEELLSLVSFAAVSNMYLHLIVEDINKPNPLVAQCKGPQNL